MDSRLRGNDGLGSRGNSANAAGFPLGRSLNFALRAGFREDDSKDAPFRRVAADLESDLRRRS
jgi:hypothetical protein